MPVHDWSRVDHGTFHDFQIGWIAEIRKALNKGVLPPNYYAQIEQHAGSWGPDFATTEMERFTARQNTLAIRHASDDRVVALIELVSPGNKSSKHGIEKFVPKACECLRRGVHLLIVDILPPTVRDPRGIHGAIWSEIEGDGYTAPRAKPLTLVSYSSGEVKTAYVEPIAVGDVMIDMPLFLDAESYVPATYEEEWSGVPSRWKKVLK